jgi:starvation-inducible outer membrane lipoprotein
MCRGLVNRVIVIAGDKVMKIFWVFLLFLLFGCASPPPPTWEHTGKTDKEFKKDLEECRFLSTKSDSARMGGLGVTDQSRLFEQCMKMRGYHLVKDEAKKSQPNK